MTQKERMLANLPFKPWEDNMSEARLLIKCKLMEYNTTIPSEFEKIDKLIREIVGQAGKNIHVEFPFYCDNGYNIEVGDNFYSNHNLVILDVGKVTIGNNVMFGPNVGIYTASHPIHPDSRNSGYESGANITIGDNVWIGGSSVVNPGVNIGKNVVIGSGSVVTKDIPDNMIAVGNPCKVVREITEDDRKYYFKNREFDVTDY